MGKKYRSSFRTKPNLNPHNRTRKKKIFSATKLHHQIDEFKNWIRFSVNLLSLLPPPLVHPFYLQYLLRWHLDENIEIFQVPLYIQQNIFWLNMFLHILHPFLDYPRTQLYIPSSIHPSFTDSSIHPSFHPSYLYSEAEFPPIIIEPRTHRIILFLLFDIRLSGFRFLVSFFSKFLH